MVGGLFHQNGLFAIRKVDLRENVEGLLGTGSQNQIVCRSVDRGVQEQALDRLSQILQSFLLGVVVKKIVFSTDQRFIDTKAEVFIGLMAVVCHSQLNIFLFVLVIFQDIVAALRHGIDILLITKLNQGLLGSILAALVAVCQLADGGNLLPPSKSSLVNVPNDFIHDDLVFSFCCHSVPLQISFSYFTLFRGS